MATTKALKITYWASTGFIFLFEGVMPALTTHTEVAVEGIRHLGYPDYFRVMLSVFKVAGALALILPLVPARIKEWAYAGFVFTMLSASVSHWVVDGIGEYSLFPLFVLAILTISYLTYHKLQSQRKDSAQSHVYHRSAVSGVAQ
ncbi:DoxX family protein [Telluribacter sp. SYSU D00476]|uniref:DoxX family protein n=1 Tax=Telluribacter sp. SYSU D00476 TaxID=2811430 RepID=UPI001FF1BB8C|nr:DoxX family protein [Telluribacter sp. SYSU D00476]